MIMPNIGTLMRQEIVKLSRREARAEVESTRKASRASARTSRSQAQGDDTEPGSRCSSGERSRAIAAASAASESNLRYSAKGLHSQRTRLGFSAADYASCWE